MHDRWMQTYSGRQFFFGPFAADTPNDIYIPDIARSLSRQLRFLGHTGMPVTIAEHSVVVSEIIQAQGGNARRQFYGLMHDAHEAYTGDIIAPLKAYLNERYNVNIRGLENEIQESIYKACGVPLPEPVDIHAVHEADMIALAAERKLFAPSQHPWRADTIAVPDFVLGSYGNWESDEACRYFEKNFDRLLSAVNFEVKNG